MEGNYDFVNKEIHKPIISKIFKRNNYNKSDFLNLTIALCLLQYQWYNYAWKNYLEYQGGNHLNFDCSKIHACNKSPKYLKIKEKDKILILNLNYKWYVIHLLKKYKNIDIYLSYKDMVNLYQNSYFFNTDKCILEILKENNDKVYIINPNIKSDTLGGIVFDSVKDFGSTSFFEDLSVFNNYIDSSTTIITNQYFLEDNKRKSYKCLVSKHEFDKQLKIDGFEILKSNKKRIEIINQNPRDKYFGKRIKIKERTLVLKKKK